MCGKGYLEIEWYRKDEAPHYDLQDLWALIRKKRWIVQEPNMDIYCCKKCAL